MPSFDLSTALVGEQFRLQIPSALEWIAPTIDYLKERAVGAGVCDEARGRKLAMALHEALTNSVVHGNLEISSRLKEEAGDAFARALAERGGDPAYCERTVVIGVDFDGESCRWSLTDEGRGFDVEATLQRLEPSEENFEIPSGRGIIMMKAFLDDVRFESGGRRVVMTMVRACKKEHRQHPRLPAQKPVRLAPIRADGSVDWDAANQGLMRDYSAGGVAVLQQDLAKVERIIIGVDLDGESIYLPAEVRHWKSLDAGAVEIGCRFLVQQPDDVARAANEFAHVREAVEDLLKRLDTPQLPADERRAHGRVGYTERIGVEGTSATDPQFAFARDLSRGGIAFITTAPVTLETKVLSLPRKNARALRIRVRVVRCVAVAEGFYDVGASFEALAE